jgi:hypothetical protein
MLASLLVLVGLSLPTPSPQVRQLTTLSARLLLKDPLANKCREAGMKECEHLIEAVLLRIEEKTADAIEQLRIVTVANSPEQLKSYSQTVLLLSQLPGAGDFGKAIHDAAAFIADTSTPSRSTDAQTMRAGNSETSSAHQTPLSPLNAPAALVPLSGMVAPASDASVQDCNVAGIAAACSRAHPGAMTLTDLYEVGNCHGLVFGLAAAADGTVGAPRWAVSLNSAHPSLTGAHLDVRANEALYLAVEKKHRAQCAVSWAGTGTPDQAQEAVHVSSPPKAITVERPATVVVVVASSPAPLAKASTAPALATTPVPTSAADSEANAYQHAKAEFDACAPLVPATIRADAPVRSSPDGNSPGSGSLSPASLHCVSAQTFGFGFRQVARPSANVGYVSDEDVFPLPAPRARKKEAMNVAAVVGPLEIVDAAHCAPLRIGRLAAGAEVRRGPADDTDLAQPPVNQRLPACVSNRSQGYGYRKVRLAGSTQGFVREAEVE